MSDKSIQNSRSYTTPWTLRAYDALPGNPVWIGIGFTVCLLILFFAGRGLMDGADGSSPADLRVAITQILMTTFSASAYAYLLMTARKTTHDLSPVFQHLPQWPAIVDRAGKHPRWVPLLAGVASYLLIGIPVTNWTTPAPINPWDWQLWNYDVYWHRATTVFFISWFGCLNHVIVVESARFSRLADHIDSVDLLELQSYRPLVRQGLTNAVLVIGAISVISLLGVDSRYWPFLVVFWTISILFAWAGMILPLRGIRRKIQAAQNQELDWCRQSLKIARNELKSGTEGPKSIAQIMAYQTMLENVRNWPFDHPTLIRFMLYLMIPLGSWLGGAFVERGVDFFLS